MTRPHSSVSVQATLRERVKELTCLYGIAQIDAKPGISMEQVLQGIVDLLPAAWQYPDITSARIVVDGRSHATWAFRKGPHRQAADIAVAGRPRGHIEIFYARKTPAADEGPFLKEERSLLNTLAAQLALIIQRRDAERERLWIQQQLRHADRLATIGQLAAGVAHELNEPLGAILGFAQLAKRPANLPKQSREDLEKIETICLRAREIIRKLLFFARQVPPDRGRVSLNQVIEDALEFLKARFAGDGIDLALELAPDLPEITCDPAQLNQVLVNLVVNALQAMPKGGRLTVRTRPAKGHVRLIVEDTGIGMSEDVLEKIFVPFFTTKDVGEGTGLGLPVVHGIVTSHGGRIAVKSRPGRGTRIEIRLPLTGS